MCGVFNDVNGFAQLVYSGTERRQWLSYDCTMKSLTLSDINGAYA